MSFGRVIPKLPTQCFTRCRSLARSWIGGNLQLSPIPLGCNTTDCVILLSSSQTRGKKTKTTIKARDLPQGDLPQLPVDQADDAPARKYATTFRQHLDNMKKYPGCVVLTRVGDFYELYFDQVEQYAPLVDLKRAFKGDVPMAGFQHWNLEKYLKRFVMDLGLSVAISEQFALTPDQRAAQGGGPLYDRRVCRVVTAGTLIDESFLNAFENNFLLGVHFEATPKIYPSERGSLQSDARVGLSWLDISSGDFYIEAANISTLPSIVARIRPREIVVDAAMEDLDKVQIQQLFGGIDCSFRYQKMASKAPAIDDWTPMLETKVPMNERQDFTDLEVRAGSLVLSYVQGRVFDTKLKLQPPVRWSRDESMSIDKQSLRGLEIRETLREGHHRGSLLHSIQGTVTAGGARLLAQRLISPSLSLSVINNRLDLAQEIFRHDVLREDITDHLRRTTDTRRLLTKFSTAKGDADDLLGLARTIKMMNNISNLLQHHIKARYDQILRHGGEPNHSKCLSNLVERFKLQGPSKLAEEIARSIDEEGLSKAHSIEDESRAESGKLTLEIEGADSAGETIPSIARRLGKSKSTPSNAEDDAVDQDVWIMRRSASKILDRAHSELEKFLQEKRDLAQHFRSQLIASTLSLKSHPKLGFHCHVKGKDRNVDLSGLDGARDAGGSTKSTRSFYHPKWSDLGLKIENAKLNIRAAEMEVFNRIRAHVFENLMTLRRNTDVLNELDVACSSATIAKRENLVRPIVNSSSAHHIIGGRHPTVDLGLQSRGQPFTANDCLVGSSENIYFITGPNMAGKSTYLRQNALITILAQTGCFVPATYAEIGLVDKIFSRVGSADDLYGGRSTFMVEMLETADILKHATPRSFVIMDEVGRGTTPTDGLAIAYACLRHLHEVNGCRVLFASHFHRLAEMMRTWDGVACYCTDVAEDAEGSWSYLHRLRMGVNHTSHALKVAELAGMPRAAIEMAEETTRELVRLDVGQGRPSRSDAEHVLARASGSE